MFTYKHSCAVIQRITLSYQRRIYDRGLVPRRLRNYFCISRALSPWHRRKESGCCRAVVLQSLGLWPCPMQNDTLRLSVVLIGVPINGPTTRCCGLISRSATTTSNGPGRAGPVIRRVFDHCWKHDKFFVSSRYVPLSRSVSRRIDAIIVELRTLTLDFQVFQHRSMYTPIIHCGRTLQLPILHNDPWTVHGTKPKRGGGGICDHRRYSKQRIGAFAVGVL